MEPRHLDTGKRGEAIARNYLEEKGYRILDSNWRHGKTELDLVALLGSILVFVEVKTRSSSRFGEAAGFVDERKQALVQEAAAAYMTQMNYQWEVRFDVIGVQLAANGSYEIEHYEDAFF
ncbi:MAG: YraN family protein [Saprospiraceae bacterium]|nr:YraN family protein [Saprospiraceae bacterium]